MFIDVHCHLSDLENIEKVVANAVKKNVLIITDGTNIKSNRKVLELSEKFDNVKACLGIYPIETLRLSDKEIKGEINFIEKQAKKIWGIGEVGMDFVEHVEVKKQEKAFSDFVKLAIKLDKPIVVHSRKAEGVCIEILEKLKAKKVIMHYFSGKMKLVDRIVGNNWFLSVPTAVKRVEQFQKVVERVPIENLLCETDSPWSHPDREFPNEPGNVLESYKMIAKIKKMSLKDVEKQLETNFKKL